MNRKSSLIRRLESDFFQKMFPVLRKLERGYNPCLRPLHDPFKNTPRLKGLRKAEAGIFQAHHLHLLDHYRKIHGLPRNFSGYPGEFYQKHIRQSLLQAFQHVDEDGVIRGDSKATAFSFFTHYLAFQVLECLNPQKDPELKSVADKLKASVKNMEARLTAYARHQKPAFRGLNLIFLDLATLAIAGRFFGRKDWLQAANAGMKRAIHRQDPEGFYIDHKGPDERGPSSNYHFYSLTTLYPSLLEFSHLIPAKGIVRAVDWHFKNFYPCLHCCSTFDERERHSNDKELHVSPLFLHSPVGRQVISELLEKDHDFPDYELARMLFFTKEMTRLQPSFLKSLEKSTCWPLRSARHTYVSARKKHALIRKKPWVLAFQTYLSPHLDPHALWHREIQEHFSIYHDRAGLVFGGGNSLGQAEFSNLATSASHLCDAAVIRKATETRQEILLQNQGWKILIRSEIHRHRVTFSVSVTASGKGRAWFQLPLFLYQTRQKLFDGKRRLITNFSKGKIHGKLHDQLFVTYQDLARFPLCFHGSPHHQKPVHLQTKPRTLRIQFSQPCQYRWPIRPVNIRMPGRKPLPFPSSMFLLQFELGEKSSPIQFSVDEISG